MAYDLHTFLNNHKAKEGEPYTHQSIAGGKYLIPFEEKETFLNLIGKYAFKEKMCYTEVPQDITNIKIDLDFMFSTNNLQRRYDINFIKNFVERYNSIILKYLDVPTDKLKAFVFEKDTPYIKNGVDKDGIHFMYPDIICDVKIQEIIRHEALTLCEPIISPLESITPMHKIIDKGIIRSNGWCLYGCSKKDTFPYKLTHIIDSELNDLSVRKYSNEQLVKLLSTRDHKIEESIPIRCEFANMLNATVEKDIKKEAKTKPIARIHKKTLFTNDTNLDEVKKLVDILSSERATEYDTWNNVGMCLSHISNNLLDDFIMFSKKTNRDNFNEETCIKFWNSYKEGSLGLGSLHMWAKADSPLEYSNIIGDSIRLYIDKSKSKQTQDIANVIYNLYKFDYKYVPYSKGGKWYEFSNHKWIDCKGAISLYQKIGHETVNEYLKVIAYYSKSAMLYDDSRKEELIKNNEILTSITYQLRDIGKKEKFEKECRFLFCDTDFEEKLDSNPDLLCFNNGVYDLRTGTFRDGVPEDNISLCTGIDYVKFNEEHEYLIQINEFLYQIFPEDDKREYMIKILASMLEGRNAQEKFYCLSGCGGNGKSKLNELLENCMGTYIASVPTTLFTKASAQSSAANPEIARLRGVRIVTAQETAEKDVFNIELVKKMTGGDKMIARHLYGEFFEFYPQFKILFSCNHKPQLPADDEAIWRRFSVIEFLSRFVKNPDPRNKFEHKRDDYLTDKLEMWKEAFMYMLLESYKDYKRDGIIDPQCVIDATNEYRKSNDTLNDFITEMIIDDPIGSIKLDESYNAFKMWWKQSIDGKPPIRNNFKLHLEKKFGKYSSSSGWVGHRLVVKQEEMQSKFTGIISEEELQNINDGSETDNMDTTIKPMKIKIA